LVASRMTVELTGEDVRNRGHRLAHGVTETTAQPV
jgi:hypothetical protein